MPVSAARAADVWSSPSFTADAKDLRQAADTVKPQAASEATVLLNETVAEFDAAGRLTQTRHLIYRIENPDGVENWAETSGQWEPWHQARPEVKARVITTDGNVHWLDPKTLSDLTTHDDEQDTYGDERKYGGPLPALAVGAIVEEQVITRDTAPLFSAGMTERWRFAWNVPVNSTRFVLRYPSTSSVRYQVHLLPDANIAKSSENGLETVTIEHGPLPAFTQSFENVPPDVVVFPEVEFSTGSSWEQVASEYARLTEDKLRSSDLGTMLGSVNKKGDRIDVVRGVVAALHKNVRYTGVEFGQDSLIPQAPSETLRRRYGDCKDKAALLVAMLRSVGIAANLALLDAGTGRDINPDLPGMGMFDHAIVYVPPSASDPELWIDATAQLSQVGSLPWMDYGRWALIVSADTKSLKKIPELTAALNVHRELREFTLTEHGPAKIVETDDEIGPEQADYRQYYSGDAKKVREESEKYVKNAYLADSLTALEHDDLYDLGKPGSIKFVTEGKRGQTDLTSAVMAIRVEDLFNSLPNYFKTKEDDATTDKDAAPPRTVDWQINPFTTEWHYKITAPLGFKLRALPPDKNQTVGSLSFREKYTANADGTAVEAWLRVENTTTRMTVQQGKDLRDAVVKARASDPIFISFDNIGHSLMAEGKIKEGLAAYRQLAAQHPNEALHKIQLAQALLDAGLGEEARAIAREATVLEPKSALAFSTLGKVLKHDLIGRLLEKGMDYDGAVEAYKQSLMLDPKDKETRANLALLFEYDQQGIRYGDQARLKDAVAQLHELKKIDEDYGRTYDDNILFDLWYARDFQGLLDYAATIPTSETRKGLTLAAIAALQGTDAALKRSLEMTTDDQERGRVLVNAASLLVRVRRYAEGSALYAQGARGQSNESQLIRSAGIYSKAKPYEELKFGDNDPRSVAQRLYAEMLSGKLTFDEFESLTFHDPRAANDPDAPKHFQLTMSAMTSQLRNSDLPLTTLADLTVSNMRYTVEGDDSLGYKIIIETPGAAAQTMYVTRDHGRYKAVDYSISSSDTPEDMGWLALAALDENNLPAARKWLDRARDEIHMGGGDDPLSGAAFPFFWTKGQAGDAKAARLAALVLLRNRDLTGSYLAELVAARTSATDKLVQARLAITLAYAYSSQERWAEMLPVVEDLAKSFPESLRGFDLLVRAYVGLKRWDDWDRLVKERRQAQPDEVAYVRSAAQLAVFRGDFANSREITKGLMDKGQADADDLNLYAWYALFLPSAVDQSAIDAGVRGNDLTSNNNFAILHTLGCVDAASGKTSQARELFLKAMASAHMDEPSSEIWFGFGLIAEQYGESEAATKMYDRVEKPKTLYPGDTYGIAQQHEAALRKNGNALAKAIAQ